MSATELPSSPFSEGPRSRDYFAEMYVAGVMADAKWNIYFPRRDKGFDFIAVKEFQSGTIMRPIQVKGKYPTAEKTDKDVYGYVGKLSLLHKDMVLAIVFFDRAGRGRHPLYVAYMPFECIKPHARGYRCQPAVVRDGDIRPRRDFLPYFDDTGLESLSSSS